MAKGTMDRIADILKSNVNEALNRIEDPVKMVDQITRDVEEEVDKAVAALASAMATQRRLEREVQRNAQQIQVWQAKAEGAVEAGDEDYARLVLAQKARLEQTNDRLEPVLAESGEKAAFPGALLPLAISRAIPLPAPAIAPPPPHSPP